LGKKTEPSFYLGPGESAAYGKKQVEKKEGLKEGKLPGPGGEKLHPLINAVIEPGTSPNCGPSKEGEPALSRKTHLGKGQRPEGVHRSRSSVSKEKGKHEKERIN